MAARPFFDFEPRSLSETAVVIVNNVHHVGVYRDAAVRARAYMRLAKIDAVLDAEAQAVRLRVSWLLARARDRFVVVL